MCFSNHRIYNERLSLRETTAAGAPTAPPESSFSKYHVTRAASGGFSVQ